MHSAFLRSICETPLDDAVRLIYADWLQEHLQEERAEFIRVQCELVTFQWECRGGHHCSWMIPCPGCSHHQELQKQNRSWFVNRHGGGDAFLDVDKLSYTLESVEYTYHRGFVDTLETTTDVFLDLVKREIILQHPITQVFLSDRHPQEWYPDADFHDSGAQQGYYWDDWWDEEGNQPVHALARQVNRQNKHMLPKPIFDRLLGARTVNPSAGLGGSLRKVYSTLDEAVLRPSQACVNYGRKLVNLPPLYTETT